MRLAACGILLALLGMAGCAPAATNTARTAAATARPGEGTILSLRPVTPRSDAAPWRVALLADAGGTPTATDNANSGLTEFIVRTDAGSTISVVQTNEARFHPGDRVIVLRDGRTYIARPR